MSLEQRIREESLRIKRLGWMLVGLGALSGAISTFIPTDETVYWTSSEGQQGFCVLSFLFAFLGLYCFGAAWRRRHFL